MIIRNAEVEGRLVDVRLEDGRIAEIGERLAGRETMDARGGALIPGLIDHHIHLLGLAAQLGSVVLDDTPDLARRLRAGLTPGRWLRATGYHERLAGDLDRHVLDRIVPDHPVRVQHQTGALWVLNSAALARVLDGEPPPCVELDEGGEPTGRIWRGDAWLSQRIGAVPPRLDRVGALLAAHGITAVTDTSASTTPASAALIGETGLPQRLTLMSGGFLPDHPGYRVGAVKVLLDDHALPDFDDMLGRIAQARAWGRYVAVHCVTAGELAFTLAAFETAGGLPGDRIEHGGVIAPEAIPVIAALGLRVVTQPGFIFERGDRYLADVPGEDHDSLYRCASLLAGGVKVAFSSDAPYTDPDPWAAMAAGMRRRTRAGAPLGLAERVDGATALGLYLDGRRVTVGAPADLCLLKTPLAEALADPSAERVAATFVGGRPACERAAEAA